MKLAAPNRNLVCQGEIVVYTCNAGGLNIRFDNHSLDTVDIACAPGGAYDYPAPADWPRCISSLTCPPMIDPSFGNFACEDDTLPAGSK